MVDFETFPAGDRKAPVFLVLPGGSYTGLSEHEGAPVAHWLNSLGLHAVVVSYSTGRGCFPKALIEVREVLGMARDEELGLQSDGRVGVLGFSAGGHLGALLATDSDDVSGTERWSYVGHPDVAILGYPVTDLRETLTGRIPNLHFETASQLLNDPSAELLGELSPATRVTAPEERGDPVPPMFIWSTSDDDGVPVLHSLELMNALAVAGHPFEAHIFRTGEHGLGLAAGNQDVGQWLTLARSWLDSLGWIGD